MLKDRSKLTTEKRNTRSTDIDRRTTLEIVEVINSEDALIAPAVGREKENIAAAVELVVASFRKKGRLFYVGAGTSGRLGVLDASECPPTFGVSPTMVQGIIAGGKRALVRSAEGAEDDKATGAKAIERKRIKSNDVVVGIAACGVTPFVAGAIEAAKKIGAKTIYVTCAPEAKKFIRSDVIINPVVGPEVVTGSTRMKAGTATKMVLNTLTTTAMIRLGKVYGNLMVDLRATNNKLRDRATRIIVEATGLSKAGAAKLLDKAKGQAKVAIVIYFRKVDFDTAVEILAQCDGQTRCAIAGK
ncbi:MAG: N-acetylmuramic acid 6-phosphate etherase [Phycisphaerae bacterium]|jgi:N-acetylmuramic acid 6-phosphate etherase|nr:N-acetylmuramic acid 6-phosphate etherase [Phycisphaerae bacterium]